jgi:hypothetical protein
MLEFWRLRPAVDGWRGSFEALVGQLGQGGTTGVMHASFDISMVPVETAGSRLIGLYGTAMKSDIRRNFTLMLAISTGQRSTPLSRLRWRPMRVSS